MGPYIVDFACLRMRLVIEVDGGQHFENPEDMIRDRWLEEQGFRVLRFWNHEVLGNLDGVLEVILGKMGGRRETAGRVDASED
jgi:very-short-patch-repair endonuclease